MRVSIADAEERLDELMQRAEAGEEVIVTIDAHPAVRMVPIQATPERAARRELLESVRATAARRVTAGPSAARSQDLLYDEDGLPR